MLMNPTIKNITLSILDQRGKGDESYEPILPKNNLTHYHPFYKRSYRLQIYNEKIYSTASKML